MSWAMSTIRTLRRPGVARLGGAGLLSGAGDWMLFIALPLFVLKLSGSPLVTATVFALEVVPTGFAGPFVGVLIDKYDPWRLMTVVAVAQGLFLLPLLLVHSEHQLWLVYLVVAVEAVLGAVIEPGRAATAAALTPSAELIAVNQVMGLLSGLARLVGGPVGGLALSFGGIDLVLMLDSGTFVAAAVLLGIGPRPRPPRRCEAESGTPWGVARSYAEGLRRIASTSLLRRIMGIAVFMALAQGAFVVLFVLFVLRDLGGTEADVGLLRGLQAIGAIAGAGLLGLLARLFSAARLVAASLLAFGTLSLVIWNAPFVTKALGLYISLFVVVGVPALLAMTGLTTLLQAHAGVTFRGRVLGTFFAIQTGVQAVGMLMAGLVGTHTGLSVALQIQGGMYVLAGLLALRLHAATPEPPLEVQETDRELSPLRSLAAGPAILGRATGDIEGLT